MGAEEQAGNLEFIFGNVVVQFSGRLPDLGPAAGVAFEFFGQRNAAEAIRCELRKLRVAYSNRAALDLIAFEQLRAAPSLQRRGKFPAKVRDVFDRSVVAGACSRCEQVCGNTGWKNPALSIAIDD